MKLYIIITILFFYIFHLSAHANMASPIMKGSVSSSAFSSRNIDILKEKIEFKIDPYFTQGKFTVYYFIKCTQNGKQIPLLFHAVDYSKEFKVWVDNIPTSLLNIPAEVKHTQNTNFEAFSHHFNQESEEESDRTVIYWEEKSGQVCHLNELQYFETDLTAGTHEIRVEYTATPWMDMGGWISEMSFRYALSPAKHWKSFSGLELIIDASEFKEKISCNLGNPMEGNMNDIAKWKFSKIPADFISIQYIPKASVIAELLMTIGPLGISIIFSLIFFLIHYFILKKLRKNNPEKTYKWIRILTSFLIPFFMLLSYMLAFDIIDAAIGDSAGQRHGYTFMVFIYYPVLVPVYYLFNWLVSLKK